MLNALRYTPAESTALANALYQLEAAKAVEINQQSKSAILYTSRTGWNSGSNDIRWNYDGQPDAITSGGAGVFFDSPEAIDPRDGQASVARIKPGQQDRRT